MALCGIFLLLISPGAARAERKVALVVGNSQYKNPSLALVNPRNDVRDVATALRALDFEVIATEDASKRDFDGALARFARLALRADAALFFYAGHALQYQGRNYLMPVDSEVEDDVSLRYQLVSFDDVRAAVEQADGVKIVILDACRNNPIADNLSRKRAGLSRGPPVTRGLARIDKALGMVVAYSTAADEVAVDGTGRNSPFTSAFLKRLKEPGLEIGSLFRRVAADVNEDTQGRQRPETYVSLIGEYYINQTDQPVWNQIKDTEDANAFRNFIQRFPSSPRASDAIYRLAMLERTERARNAEQFRAEQARLEEQRMREDRRMKDAAAARLKAERDRIEREEAASQTAAKLAADEQARADQQKRAAEEQRAREEEKRRQVAALTAGPLPTTAQPVLDRGCEEDTAKLARLSVSPSLEDVARFEKDLRCERLRPQLVRLRESIATPAPPGSGVATPVSRPGADEPDKSAMPPPPQVAVQTPQDKPPEQPHAPAAPPSRPQTKATAPAEHRRMTTANCNAINERAQLGDMTDEDRETLKNCRGNARP